MRFFDRKSELADLQEIRERSEGVAQFTVVTDSTAALESLAENVEFVNTPARKRGQVFVEDNGTKLVYKGIGGGTMIVVQ